MKEGDVMPDHLETRVLKLERESRAMKRGALLVLVLAVGVACARHTPESQVSDQVTARVLNLVDDTGNLRASLTSSRDGGELTLYNGAGTARCGLGIYEGGPLLALTDDAGKIRVSLAVVEDGPALGLSDETGTMRVGLAAFAAGPRLDLADEAGNVIWRAP